MTNELAEDADNNKWLEKVERVAGQKAAKHCKKRKSAVPWKLRRHGQSELSACVVAGVPSAVQPLSHPAVPKPNMLAGRKPTGPCFALGEMGHLCASWP